MNYSNKSLKQLESILKLKPDDLLLNKALAKKCLDIQNYQDSIKYLSKIVLLEQTSNNYYNLGVALQCSNRLDDAAQMYEQVLSDEPVHLSAMENLAVVYFAQRDYSKSIMLFHKVLENNPKNFRACANISKVLICVRMYEEAINYADYLISYADGDEKESGFHLKLEILQIMGMHEERAQHLTNLVEQFPTQCMTEWALANEYLSQGRYLEAWPLYEARWKIPGGPVMPAFQKPKWLGKTQIVNKKLLVHSEQGLGDTLQFCRFIPELQRRTGADISFIVPEELFSLLNHFPGASYVGTGNMPIPSHNAHIPLMSVPLALEMSLENMPAFAPYISAEVDRSTAWREKLQTVAPHQLPRIGLVWSGGFRPRPDSFALNDRRNIPLKLFESLKELNLIFISLQKGEEAEREHNALVQSGWGGPTILDFTREIHDFADTAALIDNIDLLISVDTSVAHLAAAMGKPVWLLNRHDSCWRWLRNRTDSPWYPSLRIFNQKKQGDWEGVLSEVRDSLHAAYG